MTKALLGGLALASTCGPAQARRHQLWYRDPLPSPCSSGFNLTNGIEIAWSP